MKRLLALVAAAALAVALYSTTATGGQQAVTPGQFTALKKQVTKMRKELTEVEGLLGACVFARAVPLAQNSGYVFRTTAGTETTTTALDEAATGETPKYWVLTTPQDCATAINSGGGLRALHAHVGSR